MRRSICLTHPAQAIAGETNTWQFTYTPSVSLPKNTLLRFDLNSKGRHIDWEIPEIKSKTNANLFAVTYANGKPITVQEVWPANKLVPYFQFRLPAEVPAGSSIKITMGAPKGKDPVKHGNRCQQVIQRRRPFNLFVDPTGKGNFHDPEIFTVDIKGSELHTIKILAPSFAIKNKRFDIVLRFEDEFGNLTNNAPEKTLIELSHENLRENLRWKLFVPETGFLTLPNLYFNEPGVYTIELKNMNTKETFRSSPIMCFPEECPHLFWGLLHGESERFDSSENIDSCLRHLRDEKSLNFFAASPFENQEETPNELWKSISQTIEELDEDERFNCFLGFQFAGAPKTEGLRHIIYGKFQKPILRKKDARSNTISKIYKLYSPKDIISVISLPMMKNHLFTFDNFEPEYERLVEIYNAWGSSEHTTKEGNLHPITTASKKGNIECAEGSCLAALKRNLRFGFVAGGLDDRGVFADFFESDQKQYSPGLTAVLADTLTKASIFDALYNRHCYATTGPRIILGLFIAGANMGSELDTTKKPGLAINRHITGYVAGTKKLKRVELIRNGEVVKTFPTTTHTVNIAWDDTEQLSKIVIDAKDKKPPFIFYYLRVVQEDNSMAWSSPIWIDVTSDLMKQQKAKKK